jgi:cellulose synthase/poly-beta-1,6-N-acetylglucosamine synthase-like glycosyltransferase
MYDIFVICDNCTDNTAQIAREHGVYAMERFNSTLRGKGFAIEWMLRELWSRPKQYDAVAMFDADNLVAPNYLREMNDDLCNGSRVIQAYLDTKNPVDSWITSAYGITYWFCNRLWQVPRRNLKMANFLGGTGMCFDSKLLKEMGWGATSLVEDLEFTMRCVKRGVYPTFNYDAKVYDEKPITFQASARQRLRWMQGHFDVARRYFFPLLWAGIKERSLTKIDTALYSVTVYNVLISFIFSAILFIDQVRPGEPNFISIYNFVPASLGVAFMLLIYMQFPLALALEKVKSWKLYAQLLLFPLFLASWYPITFHAFFTQNNKQWSHTKHTRVLRLDDVQKL